MKTGELIRKYRKEKKMTMKELGEIVGVSEQAISQYERGARNINLETLIKISSTLGVTVNDLSDKKELSAIQSLLKNEILDKGITFEELSKQVDVSKEELEGIYNGENPYTMGSIFKFLKYFNLDDMEIMKAVTEHVKINSIYNNDGTDIDKTKLRKLFLGEPLSVHELIHGVEDLEDMNFINHIFNLNNIKIHNYESSYQNHDHELNKTKSQEINVIKTPYSKVNLLNEINIHSAFESLATIVGYMGQGDLINKIDDNKYKLLFMKTIDFLEYELFKIKSDLENDGDSFSIKSKILKDLEKN